MRGQSRRGPSSLGQLFLVEADGRSSTRQRARGTSSPAPPDEKGELLFLVRHSCELLLSRGRERQQQQQIQQQQYVLWQMRSALLSI